MALLQENVRRPERLVSLAGLLDNREATTSWWLAHHFNAAYPDVNLQLEKIVTEDNNILCSGAVTAYLHLCISLIEKFAGTGMAEFSCVAVHPDYRRRGIGAEARQKFAIGYAPDGFNGLKDALKSDFEKVFTKILTYEATDATISA